ncbi:hypothetical protein BJX66DRAFT_345827 [Aspergillus keveii]|uniref:BTB domain-containing protein n=1 Tax=Aspergillus keveii TaxID=714993 RepID=A0ABR4FGU4_9EURO
MAEVGEHMPNTVVDIAADGDVILVVGPERLKLRVHSLNLKATSRPFSAMLGPIWKEGRDLLQDESVEILLPEDNAKAMEYICAVTHQNKMMSHTMTPLDVLEVAVVADKYDLVDALRFASESWLHARNARANELKALTGLKIEPLCPAGNVTVVCKNGPPDTGRAWLIYGSSDHQELISPWFCLALNDEEPALLGLLFEVLHFRPPQKDVQMGLKNIAQLAILCEKYSCCNALRPWSSRWLSHAPVPATPEESGYALASRLY